MPEELRTLKQINDEWLAAYKSRIDTWPIKQLPQLTDLIFLGHKLIAEADVIARLEAFQAANEVIHRTLGGTK